MFPNLIKWFSDNDHAAKIAQDVTKVFMSSVKRDNEETLTYKRRLMTSMVAYIDVALTMIAENPPPLQTVVAGITFGFGMIFSQVEYSAMNIQRSVDKHRANIVRSALIALEESYKVKGDKTIIEDEYGPVPREEETLYEHLKGFCKEYSFLMCLVYNNNVRPAVESNLGLLIKDQKSSDMDDIEFRLRRVEFLIKDAPDMEDLKFRLGIAENDLDSFRIELASTNAIAVEARSIARGAEALSLEAQEPAMKNGSGKAGKKKGADLSIAAKTWIKDLIKLSGSGETWVETKEWVETKIGETKEWVETKIGETKKWVETKIHDMKGDIEAAREKAKALEERVSMLEAVIASFTGVVEESIRTDDGIRAFMEEDESRRKELEDGVLAGAAELLEAKGHAIDNQLNGMSERIKSLEDKSSLSRGDGAKMREDIAQLKAEMDMLMRMWNLRFSNFFNCMMTEHRYMADYGMAEPRVQKHVPMVSSVPAM